jgi:putative hemolysin
MDAGYRLRLASTREDVRAAQFLRFAVFNLELNEGLDASYATLLDSDPFDEFCNHLLVEDGSTGNVVGTYRLQTGATAAAHLGYYSEQEFDLSPYESMRSQVIELGRACVDRSHRNLSVLGLLWKGIAQYAEARGGRYLIGCSSLPTVDPAQGAAAYATLGLHQAPKAWQTRPKPQFAFPVEGAPDTRYPLPKLLRAYLSLGARICGPPALDREFRTVDFLTILDLECLDPMIRARLLT